MTKRVFFEKLKEIGADLFENGHFDASLHALTSAFHLAVETHDRNQLQEVGDIAGRYAESIQTHLPANRLAAHGLDGSRKPGSFELLAYDARKAAAGFVDSYDSSK
jgi:hypothetical protein